MRRKRYQKGSVRPRKHGKTDLKVWQTLLLKVEPEAYLFRLSGKLR